MSGRNRLETVSLCAQHPRKNAGRRTPRRARGGCGRHRSRSAWCGACTRGPRRAAAPLAPAPRDACRGTPAATWPLFFTRSTYKSHASSVRRNVGYEKHAVTPRPRAVYGSYVSCRTWGYTSDRARTAPPPPATATFVIGIVRAIGFGSEIGISARVRARAAVVVQFFDVRKLYNSFRGSRCRGRGMRCRMFDAATIGPFS